MRSSLLLMGNNHLFKMTGEGVGEHVLTINPKFPYPGHTDQYHCAGGLRCAVHCPEYARRDSLPHCLSDARTDTTAHGGSHSPGAEMWHRISVNASDRCRWSGYSTTDHLRQSCVSRKEAAR